MGGINMKNFDLQKAKEGHPVCTRDGRKARIVCFDLKNPLGYTIVACITTENGTEEETETYTNQGLRFEGTTSRGDLFMVSERREGWVNIYSQPYDIRKAGVIYDSKQEALSVSQNVQGYITTTKIEWEE